MTETQELYSFTAQITLYHLLYHYSAFSIDIWFLHLQYIRTMASTSYLPAIEKVIKSEPLDESDDLIEPLEVFTDRSSLSGKRKRKRSISHDIDQPIPAIRVVKEEQIDPEEEFEIIPPEINRLSSSPISNSGAPSSVLRTPSLRLADRASCLISETPRLLPAVRRMKAASGPITSPVLEPANSTISGSSGPSEAETR